MARRESTTKTRVRKIRESASLELPDRLPHSGFVPRKRASAVDRCSPADVSTSSLWVALDAERRCLVQAECVLECLHVALLNSVERVSKYTPDYAKTAEFALQLVRQSLRLIDLETLEPLVRKFEKSTRQSKADRRVPIRKKLQ